MVLHFCMWIHCSVNVNFKGPINFTKNWKIKSAEWNYTFVHWKDMIFVDLKINKNFAHDLSCHFSTGCPNKALNNSSGC